MDDLEALLKKLRAMGVKAATFREEGALASVEFYPTIQPLDFDTLVPPARDDDDGPAENIPAAISRILRNGSVS